MMDEFTFDDNPYVMINATTDVLEAIKQELIDSDLSAKDLRTVLDIINQYTSN